MSLNYDWLAEIVPRLAGNKARVLDFGCGRGHATKAVLARNPDIDIMGADTFEGYYADWRDSVGEDLRDRVVRIEDGVLPFADGSMDLVFANQVFEHVFEPEPALAEIARVLKPGGVFLALFPCRGTWYEGHVGLYFAHWLIGRPRALRLWLNAGYRLGFGLYRKASTAEDWSESKARVLEEVCIYHRWSDIRRMCERHFGHVPQPLEADNMGFRLRRSRVSPLAPLASLPAGQQAAQLVHRLRGGRIFTVRKRR